MRNIKYVLFLIVCFLMFECGDGNSKKEQIKESVKKEIQYIDSLQLDLETVENEIDVASKELDQALKELDVE